MKIAFHIVAVALVALGATIPGAHAQRTNRKIGVVVDVKPIGHVGVKTSTTTAVDRPQVGGREATVAQGMEELRAIDIALRNAIAKLEKHAKASEMTREKFDVLRGLLVARARAAAQLVAAGGPGIEALMPPEGWTFEFYRALQRLEALAKADKMDRAEFEAIKKRLLRALGEFAV